MKSASRPAQDRPSTAEFQVGSEPAHRTVVGAVYAEGFRRAREKAECGYCEGHGYTIKIVLGYPGIAVECSECDGTGSVTGVAHQMRPRLLDLFCGAGGAGMGYHQAGFEVVGVDIEPQPNYPFEFHQADATTFDMTGFDAVHASPPCQRWAQCGVTHKVDERHPDHLTTIRAMLPMTGLPYVIENIPTAPGPWDVVLCGSMFGLPIIRHRVFQSSFALGMTPGSSCPQATFGRGVTHGPGFYPYARGAWRPAWREHVLPAVWPWMEDVEHEAGEAIPPAYTEWLGVQMAEHVRRVAA